MRRGKRSFNFKSKGSYNRRRNRGVSNVPLNNIFRGFAIVLRIAMILMIIILIFDFKEALGAFTKIFVLWSVNELILKAFDN
ncbi:hypothetical protein [Bacillus cereus]|uniref:Uncharacterized protein n=1 Tax=Bacillus cereus TaxID=1396 RepID=A0ABD4LM42_BACCE|nr:hypothetical protein [Bacillus cereus]MBK1611736.1 hypothetical protein [Bacillus cereus]